MRKSSWWPTNFITYQLTLIPNKPIKHLMRRTAAFESTTYRHLPGSPITSLPSYHLTLMTFISSGRTNLLLLAPMKHAMKDPLTSLSDSHQTSKQTASWSVNYRLPKNKWWLKSRARYFQNLSGPLFFCAFVTESTKFYLLTYLSWSLSAHMDKYSLSLCRPLSRLVIISFRL